MMLVAEEAEDADGVVALGVLGMGMGVSSFRPTVWLSWEVRVSDSCGSSGIEKMWTNNDEVLRAIGRAILPEDDRQGKLIFLVTCTTGRAIFFGVREDAEVASTMRLTFSNCI